MSSRPVRLKVTYEVTGIPDTAGLRFRTLKPWGLILSMRDPELAQWAFMTYFMALIGARKLIPLKPGEGFAPEVDPDWNATLIAGVGEIWLRKIGPADAEKLKRVQESRRAELHNRTYGARRTEIRAALEAPNGAVVFVSGDEEDWEWLMSIYSRDVDEGTHLLREAEPYLTRSMN